MMLVLSSFVFAASSEITADFTVDVPKEEAVDYVSPKSVVGNYLGYAILAFIVLAFIYFVSKKRKKVVKKKTARKRVSKKKKVSKSKK